MDADLEGLMERARSGDAAARQRLLDLHRAHLRRMISARLDPRTAARLDPSDLVQDTLFEASRRLNDYLQSPPLPFVPWLRQIAGDRLIEAHRRHLASERRSVRRENQGPMALDGSSSLLASWLVARDPSPSQQLLRQERVDRVKAALDQLPPRDREILVMRHLEHLKIDEIAGLLGITPGAAKARILRALLKMKSILGDA